MSERQRRATKREMQLRRANEWLARQLRALRVGHHASCTDAQACDGLACWVQAALEIGRQ